MPQRSIRPARWFASALFAACLLGAPYGALGQSHNVTLLANVDSYPFHSDIWGYSAPNGTEIAIIGTENGTSFVDVTDTNNPAEVFFMTGPSSIWRDIKTYQHYAYIVADEGNQGLQIVSLADPLNPFHVRTDSEHFTEAHNIWIDVPGGLLFAAGTPGGSTVILDLADPENPTFYAEAPDPYIHDLHSQGGIAYMAAILDGTLITRDMSALPASFPLLDSVVTDGAFTHNCWATEDGRYVLTTDEVTGGHITIVDVSDPSDIFRAAGWENPDDPSSIIHNVTVRGDFAYASWYKAGVQILDIAVPTQPQRVGYYDTFPGSGDGFDGAWGVYPFAASGNIYVSDMATGLYVLRFDPNFGVVAGIVTDSDTGLPIEGVRVRVAAAGAETMTGADGFYRLSLPPGPHQVDFDVFAYAPLSIPVNIVRGETLNGDAAMDPLPSGSMVGRVADMRTGAGLTGALVEIVGTPLSTESGADGAYQFDSVPAGPYAARATLFGYGSYERGFDISQGQQTRVDLPLAPSLFADDLETDRGWTVGAAGDNATTGIWIRSDPVGTGGGQVQPEDDHTPEPGTFCFVTGNGPPGGGLGENDVDGGRTTLLTPILDLSGASDPIVQYYRWYSNDAGANPGEDIFEVDVSSDGGSTWVDLENLSQTRNFWERMEFRLADFITPSNEVRLRFIAQDIGSGSIVEAAVDDLEIFDAAVAADSPGVSVPPAITRLLPAAPHPFRAGRGGFLRLQLARTQDVMLEVLDLSGRRIATIARGPMEAGLHTIPWNGRDARGRRVASGIYLQRLITEEKTHGRRLVVLR